MKKILSALIALSMVAGLAAPAFAWTAENCPFSDASLCVTESLASQPDED